ncbi:ABC transporter ATP-binding protein [Curtobacterium sp. MCBA15_005]|uniref:ABC transporter ATP-binding protein n=1 Tax=Curtobacterium sp. MCBA15_005 TaxID=1898734 RepID=UPI0008DD0DFC|nr:ABC transporter ATP-binding protein [Curtobacterium sp. MCBA15_005]OIH99187.1 hypothetical protein BIU89_06430 [Curtobacterium sp. MCBA15_005]
MLDLQAVSKSYGRHAVLRDVSGTVNAGEVVALAGPNGAGKSTLIHIVTGLTRPSAGVVLVGGVPVSAGGHTGIGFCPDDLPMPELLTGHEYLDFAEALHGSRVGRRHRERLLECLHLEDAAARLVSTFSHGMKRKLQLLAALLRAPSLLVLDEPLRGLDPESAALLRALIGEFARQGGAVLLSTHDLASAESIASRMLILQQGRLRMDERVDAMTQHGRSVEDVFLEMTGIQESVARSSRLFIDTLARAERSRR